MEQRIREGVRLGQWLVAVLALAIVAAPAGAQAEPPSGLVLGEYELEQPIDRAVIDGDTVRVRGLDSTLRLLGIDTEETFKKETERNAYKAGWSRYRDDLVNASATPVKFATPMGEEAKEFARRFFAGHTKVRLELDDTARRRGYYGRYLTYIFVQRGGKWVNYNIEAVRAGMSPYFTKYGYSLRFHDEFVKAQKEAQRKKLGIWKRGAECYPDYEKRLAWWNRRADMIKRFEDKYANRPDYVMLGSDGEWERLLAADGQEVTVFGIVGKVFKDEPPARVYLSHKKGEDFAIVSFKPYDLGALGLDKHMGEYVYVRGKVSLYKGKPQFKLDNGAVKVWTEAE